MKNRLIKQNKKTFELLAFNNSERVSILNSVIHECRKILADNLHEGSCRDEIQSMMEQFQAELKILDGTNFAGPARVATVNEATEFFLRNSQ